MREKNFMSAWSDLWIQGKMCIFCAKQWSDRYESEKYSYFQKRNENMRMNVDSEGSLRYTLFSNKRKRLLFTRECTATKKVLFTDQWER